MASIKTTGSIDGPATVKTGATRVTTPPDVKAKADDLRQAKVDVSALSGLPGVVAYLKALEARQQRVEGLLAKLLDGAP